MYAAATRFQHSPALQVSESPSDFWGEPIHVYTRAQAIADGVLVDAQVGDLHDVTRQHFGNDPVAMTAGIHALIERAVNNPKYWNDWRGVWHDICFMSKVAPGRRRLRTLDTETMWFKVIIVGVGRTRYHTLKRVMVGTPTGVEVTFMLADED
jgi:hypothetical protein